LPVEYTAKFWPLRGVTLCNLGPWIHSNRR